MNYKEWLSWACSKLNKSTTPQRDSEILLEFVTKKSRSQLLAFGETLLQHNKILKLKNLIDRRKEGEPIAYLIGWKEFWSLRFKVSPGVFIPRSDTECLVEHTLNLISISHLRMLDLGSGVGTISLAIASERPQWNILGIDNQKKSLDLANKNKILFNNKNAKFIYGNWFKNLSLSSNKKFNLIVSNPPYIEPCHPCLTHDGIKFEPIQALVSNNLGLADLITICENSIRYLYHYGWLILEHGYNQGKYIRTILFTLGFTNINTIHDVHHHERVTYGQWSK